MKREEKDQIINLLSEKFEANPSFYIADVSELDVAETTQLRKLCQSKGIELRVAKNTFIRKALEKANINNEELFTALHGPSSVLFAQNVKEPAQLIKEFRKKFKKPVLKAAYITESLYLGDDSLEHLLNLKSKEELIGDVILMLNAPIRNLISALNNNAGNKIMGVLDTIEKKNA